MWGWHDMSGWDWFWMTFSMTFWIVVLGLVVYVAVRLGIGGGQRKGSEAPPHPGRSG